ncbi:hypothetical protein GN244_ATG01108 [Phytophthora infestans]|uniref:Uncharacterized protein n=1 Tax=Phytophthora infestans TaxID=4787 RepID=A0A833WNU7_PHYIN|nr:hypothetical protein GN244_ATG01108 [Phytophthora infestans]
MNQYIKNLEEEAKNAAQEETMISDEKKHLIAELLNCAGNWVLDSLHEHSNRKKVETNRLLKQAVSAADLQKLVQHFSTASSTWRSINGTVSRMFANEKVEKREIVARVEDVYSVSKPREKDEDMLMTSQIRSMLQHLVEAFKIPINRLLKEDESLQHASTRLEGEIDSINAFMERMVSEESALGATEKTSLAQESQYPVELDKINIRRSERLKSILPPEAELETAEKLIKNRNDYDRKACAEFVQRFKVAQETKERIPALKEIQKKIARQNGPASKCKDGSNKAKLADAVHPSEQWIVKMLKFKKNISVIDSRLLKDISVTVVSAVSEEDVVNATPAEEVTAEKEVVAAASTEEVL